ncbi:MAG: hypothetical protein RL739_400 [Pseudomonadota bacterium]|jgi:hypothetical protein
MRFSYLQAIPFEKALLMLLGSLVYTSAHLANLWLFDFWEVTPNISWVYLPSFLRLANLLILGPLWGTFATALGGAELIFLSDQGFDGLAWLNVLASCSSAVAAYGVLRLMIHRPVALTHLKELLLLAGLYTLINPSLHFILWQAIQAYTETSLRDFVAMAVGDLAGAVLGSVLFVWVVRHTGVAQWVAGRVLAKIDR